MERLDELRTAPPGVVVTHFTGRITSLAQLDHGPECSRMVPHSLKVDVPDPVAEQGPVKGKSTQRSDDEDGQQRPYRCSH